ncbi:MAG TPA: endopeptidase La [Patescibacteria group bacterium]|nr:endopeptidase La [Patescibacteria group bacterium]
MSTEPIDPTKPQETTIFSGEEEKRLVTTVEIPVNKLPMVALREGVVFPHTESILAFVRSRSVHAIEEAVKSKRNVVLFTQKHDVEDPREKDLYSIGVIANIERVLKNDQEVNTLVRAIARVRVKNTFRYEKYSECEVEPVPDVMTASPNISALSKVLTSEFRKSVDLGKSVEFLNFMKLMSGVNASELADQVASTLELPTKEKQKILEERNVEKRLQVILGKLQEEMKILEIERNITSKTQKKFDKHARESILRERMRVIQRELGDVDEGGEEEELEALRRTIQRSGMPAEIKTKALKELRRLVAMPEMSAESGYIRTWLDALVELPWGKYSKSSISLQKAAEILNKDHYGLEDVKDRIIEFLAVMKLRSEKSSKKEATHMPTILCFVGAPGVGKTSLGKSIAKALGREFVKISLGGIRDEAEIRGHRRTYVGAMTGRIISGMKTAKKMNPVFILDEIDKIGADYRGDPSAALLEALDPEQNGAFEDHYLDVPFDLSQVMFITTANTMDTIPPALRDRLEVIPYSGYTIDEKFEIAKRHLIPKQLKINGLSETQIKIPDAVLSSIIIHYTREAGVRSLERAIGKVMRKSARLIAEAKKKTIVMDEKLLVEFLDPHYFEESQMEKKDMVGLATGLAWTSVGGDVLSIEVALIPGRKTTSLILTGKLGKVMQESARAALTWVSANAKSLKISPTKLNKSEIHIHIPEGAVPKDGPSAGITMTTALVSALTNRPVRKDIAMTGEVTLLGRVLEIGGLKEKVIAAHRAGIREIIIPKPNAKDIVKFPDNIKKEVKFYPVEQMEEVVKIALKH